MKGVFHILLQDILFVALLVDPVDHMLKEVTDIYNDNVCKLLQFSISVRLWLTFHRNYLLKHFLCRPNMSLF